MLCLILFVGISFLTAQTVHIDLTTGTTSVGTTALNWTVQSFGTGAFNAAYVANPVNGYATDACGKWISPGLMSITNKSIPG